jgi:hypothetical protein
MSEHLPHNVEHLPHHQETEPQKERPAISVEHEHHKQHETLEHAKHEVERLANSKEDTKVEDGNKRNEQPLYVNHELKSIALQRTLVRVRRHLSGPNRLLSKVIHQPAVQAVSEAGAKTIARPSGLLLGSFTALLGSSFVLYLAKHYGFRYNYLLVFVLFVGGFVVGLALEFVIWLLRRRRIS